MTSVWTADDLTDCPDGAWIDAAVAGRTGVGSAVPPVYDAYARVLHPATVGERPIRWSTVADVNARVMHPLVEWDRIVPTNVNSQPGLWEFGPALRAPVSVRRALARILAHHTRTSQRCYYAIWEGNTILDDLRSHRTALTVAGMNHFVVVDAVAHADRDLRSIVASYWWPADRSWFVADHIDLQATYVGGNHACIDAVLADPELETFPVEPDDDIDSTADTVNEPFTVAIRAHRGWRVFTADERDQWWTSFEDRFEFRPGTVDDGYAGIVEPTPSVTFDLTNPAGTVADWAARRDAVNAEAMRCFVAHVPDGLVVLDWHHDCYLLDPVVMRRMRTPRGRSRCTRTATTTPFSPATSAPAPSGIRGDRRCACSGRPWWTRSDQPCAPGCPWCASTVGRFGDRRPRCDRDRQPCSQPTNRQPASRRLRPSTTCRAVCPCRRFRCIAVAAEHEPSWRRGW